MFDEDYIAIEAEIVEPSEPEFGLVTPTPVQLLNSTVRFCTTNY
ncbi:hypothetical protein X975_05044, partial [Stegodyphus mimosarum]